MSTISNLWRESKVIHLLWKPVTIKIEKHFSQNWSLLPTGLKSTSHRHIHEAYLAIPRWFLAGILHFDITARKHRWQQTSTGEQKNWYEGLKFPQTICKQAWNATSQTNQM
jgi:hypothetical protein